METQVQTVEQAGRDDRYITSVPHTLVEIMQLDGKSLKWDHKPGEKRIELTVVNETKVQKIKQGKSIRHVTTVPKSIVELMHLKKRRLNWKYVPDENKVELTVVDNGRGKKRKRDGI